MKKVSYVILTVILVSVLIVSSMPANAANEPDLYSSAAEGDLLYTANFYGDDNWKPVQTKGSLEMTVIDEHTAKFLALTDKGQNWIGAEIKGLPLGETNAYTIKFRITRSGVNSCFGLYVDGMFGTYGYAHRYKMMNGGSAIPGHDYVVYADAGLDIPGIAFDGTPQDYALEVNGQSSTLKLYVLDSKGQYQLIHETVAGEIICFATNNLGLYFYVYYANQPSTLSNVEIYKGMILSGEKLLETTAAPETTKAPDTTKKPETTKAPETTKVPVTTAAVTTKAPVTTTAAPVEESGCGSVLAGGAGILAIIAAVGFSITRKKR